jgi:hypothetical protein
MFSALMTTRALAAGVILLALVFVPAPLLPPHRFAQAVQSLLGLDWKPAYLVTALGMHLVFYGSLGVLATRVPDPAQSVRGRALQAAALPCIVVGVSLLIRSLKVGYLPVLTNAALPVIACVAGVGLGLALRYRGGRATIAIASVLVGTALWAWLAAPASELAHATHRRVQHLAAIGPGLPSGDARFAALVQAAFAPMAGEEGRPTAVDHNRAAILALGVTLGHERLARLVGFQPEATLLQEIAAMRAATTLSGRDDWARHYTLSAGLAVLQHPLASDAAGLMKEQLDALAQDSGFSFADLAADRAGVRFATAATQSDAAARAMQARLHRGFAVADFFPPAADLPENLTVAQFRAAYGGVGSARYRAVAAQIEARLDDCPALSPHGFDRSKTAADTGERN